MRPPERGRLDERGKAGPARGTHPAVVQLHANEVFFADDVVREAGSHLEAQVHVNWLLKRPVGRAQCEYAGGVDLDQLVEERLDAKLDDRDICVLFGRGQDVDLRVPKRVSSRLRPNTSDVPMRPRRPISGKNMPRRNGA